jgi:hypothetical protein
MLLRRAQVVAWELNGGFRSGAQHHGKDCVDPEQGRCDARKLAFAGGMAIL